MLAEPPTAVQHGLTDEQAAARLRVQSARPRARSSARVFVAIGVRQVLDPLTGLLALAACVSLAVGEVADAAVIAAIVAVNAVLGFVQEASAERAVRALRASRQSPATVRRSGRELVVPASEVVTGDLVLLREGERVVADGRLVESFGLEVDESALTGESVPVPKAVARDGDAAVFAGTAVTRGRAAAVADAVGEDTEIGRIAGLTERAKSPPTPLQRRLAQLSRQMVAAGVVLTILLAAGMLARGSSAREAFLVGVSVAVAAVPEGLATTVTIALALAARAMARRHAIVRSLDAAETLGEVTIVCTDKTGTLTENRLRVVAVTAMDGFEDSDVLAGALLASSPLSAAALDDPRAAGDPLELAIARAARDADLDGDALAAPLELVGEVPFDATRRRMTRVWREGTRRWGHVKGAPEALLAEAEMTAEARAAGEQQALAWAERGLRVLAVGRSELAADAAADDPEEPARGLRIVGLIAFEDTLRPAAREAVRAAQAAGITVRMLTGDHHATAHAVAGEVGIAPHEVFARIRPEDKLAIVEALQAEGHVVAVTGDGVNDAPALRRADVGIAMGRTGTEAAREAADVVLTDDDFSTIVAAIRAGRTIADNVRTVTAFLLSANLGEVVLFAVAIACGLGAPMTVIQILLVNLLTDGLPAIALARDRGSDDALLPRPREGDGLFSAGRWAMLAALGGAVGLAALGAFLAGHDGTSAEAQTMAFATVALAEIALVFSYRSDRLPPWRQSPNALLLASCVVSAAAVVAGVYLPVAHELLGTASVGGVHAVAVAALALVPAVLAEAVRRVHVRQSPR